METGSTPFEQGEQISQFVETVRGGLVALSPFGEYPVDWSAYAQPLAAVYVRDSLSKLPVENLIPSIDALLTAFAPPEEAPDGSQVIEDQRTKSERDAHDFLRQVMRNPTNSGWRGERLQVLTSAAEAGSSQ